MEVYRQKDEPSWMYQFIKKSGFQVAAILFVILLYCLALGSIGAWMEMQAGLITPVWRDVMRLQDQTDRLQRQVEYLEDTQIHYHRKEDGFPVRPNTWEE